jgi:hypothetical protein
MAVLLFFNVQDLIEKDTEKRKKTKQRKQRKKKKSKKQKEIGQRTEKPVLEGVYWVKYRCAFYDHSNCTLFDADFGAQPPFARGGLWKVEQHPRFEYGIRNDRRSSQ